MREIPIRSFLELHNALRKYEGNFEWMFRGQRSATWKLIPRAARTPFMRANERVYFEAWKRRAKEYVTSVPSNEWEWLVIAQHYGLPTRLLDWSGNPLIACFFAVDGNTGSDAAVYAYKTHQWVTAGTENPFKVPYEIAAFHPSAVAPRVSRQHSKFTIHSPVTKDIASNRSGELHKLTIEASYVAALQRELSYYGVNHATIYPDLEGLTRHINWIADSGDSKAKAALIKETNSTSL